MKPLGVIEREIEAFGFDYQESINIEHQGMTRLYQWVDEHGQRLKLDLWSDNQGGEQFWELELRSFVTLGNLNDPAVSMSYGPFTEETLHKIPNYVKILQVGHQKMKAEMKKALSP